MSFGSNQADDRRSISLKPGNEYTITLEPYGQTSTEDFKAMPIDTRKCRLGHEVFENATHSYYTYANCKYDCHVNLAFEMCKCVPWDFVNKMMDAKECDIFGRTCFFTSMESFTQGSDDLCPNCLNECDWIKYRKSISEPTSVKLRLIRQWHKIYQNKYLSILGRSM